MVGEHGAGQAQPYALALTPRFVHMFGRQQFGGGFPVFWLLPADVSPLDQNLGSASLLPSRPVSVVDFDQPPQAMLGGCETRDAHPNLGDTEICTDHRALQVSHR